MPRWTVLSLLLGLATPTWGQATQPADAVGLAVLGDWGWDGPLGAQQQVAGALAAHAKARPQPLSAVLLAGDNFYSKLPGGVEDGRWTKLFEQMYDPAALPVPFYAALGNHDYEHGKADVQLAYAKANPASRFKMPARWYAVDLPADRPLVRVLVLDSNTSQHKADVLAEQARWLEGQLADPRRPPWTVAVAHHPMFSCSKHGDNATVQKMWGPLLNRHQVDFYIAGHDHCLQHLQVEKWYPSFVISGGGGAPLYRVVADHRTKFAAASHGFVDLAFTPREATVTVLGVDGTVLYSFKRDKGGAVTAGPATQPARAEPANGPAAD